MRQTPIIDVESREELSEVLRRHRVVLVDFWSPLCNPCKYVEEALARAASTRLGEGVAIARINVARRSEIAIEYKVLSLPTVLVFVDGALAKRLIGKITEDEIHSAIRELL